MDRPQRRWLWFAAGVVGVFLLVGAATLLSHRADPLARAESWLRQAFAYDAQLDGCPDPAATTRLRDEAFARAERALARVLRGDPDSPAARLGVAEIAWRRDGDLATAFREVDAAIGAMETQAGAADRALLARAYALRASYLIVRYSNGVADATVPAGPLAQARDDIARALALDPRPDYELLRAQLDALAPAPLDPVRLAPR